MKIRCFSCGVDYDDKQHSDFCPHHGVVQVIGPSVAAAAPPQSALEAAKLELCNRLVVSGLSPSSFATWVDLAEVPAPQGGTHDEVPARHALFVSVTPGHPDAARTTAAIERLPNSVAGFDVHFMQGA
jgi:hypothetical protein